MLLMNEYTYIDSPSELRILIEQVVQNSIIAIDTEADSLYHYYEKVCLIQITTGGETYILDPLARLDLTDFFKVLAEKRIILHSADYDLRLLRASYDFFPVSEIFDTMLAARILGHDRLGLSALVERYFGVTLSKHGQKFNWSLRPLPENKLIYAGNDTRYLEPLMDFLGKELSQLDRMEWHRESCAMLVETTRVDRPPKGPDSIWRIKGLKELNRRQLAFLRSIWYWRDDEAKNSDLPPFKVMGNSQIITLALWASSHPGIPLSQGPKLPRNCKGDRLHALNIKINEAKELSESDWPRIKAKRKKTDQRYTPFSEEENAMLLNLREDSARIATDLGVPPHVLVSRASLESILRSRAITVEDISTNGKITRYQAELLAPLVNKILSEK
ncbi:MAG TPA: ribonuclease D [Proteobacteria bacterium]|nr:ribonuclease D [Pseudomonadota bacterium]